MFLLFHDRFDRHMGGQINHEENSKIIYVRYKKKFQITRMKSQKQPKTDKTLSKRIEIQCQESAKD